jgi:hypothetical protein
MQLASVKITDRQNNTDDMTFIYCNWISSRRKWSANLYKIKKDTAIDKRKKNTQYNTKTEYTKQKTNTKTRKEHKKNIKKHKPSN